MKNWIVVNVTLSVLLLVAAGTAVAAEPELVGHWTFSEGSGERARDSSGQDNHGRIEGAAAFVKGPKGYALRFDGVDDFVDCGASNSLQQLELGGTIELWFKPEEFQGGLVNWTTGSGWEDCRLVLAFKNYHGSTSFIFAEADGLAGSKHYYEHSIKEMPVKGSWNHVVLTFDNTTIAYYLDGRLQRVLSQYNSPKIEGVPLWIGRSQGLGAPYFKGLMDEVRIYKGALDSADILARYKEQAVAFGKEIKDFKAPLIKAQAIPEPGWIAVTIDYALMRLLPESSVAKVRVLDAGGGKVLGTRVEKIPPNSSFATLKIDATSIAAGTYLVEAEILDSDGKRIGESSRQSVKWPGQPETFKGIKILNNVVWDLFKSENISADKTFTFKSPKRRWAYVMATADASGGEIGISLHKYQDLISFEKGERTTKEAMRFLPAGEHKLTVSSEGGARIDRIVVRSIPEILLHEFPGGPAFSGSLGMSREEFTEKYVIPNVNTFVIAPSNVEMPSFKKWQSSGRRWLAGCLVPYEKDGKTYTAEQAYKHISSTAGFTNRLVHGSMADEDAGSYPASAAYAEAIHKLRASPEFKDKLFHSYEHIHALMGQQAFMKAIIDTGSTIAWKRYLKTHTSELAARLFLQQKVVDMAREFRDMYPRAMEHVAVCFGTFTAVGGHLLNSTPSVNYKVYLDTQYNAIANDPVFWGTYGLMLYHSSYSDEETIRWACNLFRHYGIEGKTEPATKNPYKSPHLTNGDFADGTQGWEIAPAEQGSIRTTLKPGLGKLQERMYWSPDGDIGLVMARSAEKPNSITQEIKNLEPGKLYTFRMMTCDYDDMSKKEKYAVRIELENVTMIPERTFTCFAPLAGFINPKTHKTWMNYHWYLFRAKGKSARVTITDWKADAEPAGPVGQQLMFNFLQVHPYYPMEE